MITKEGVLRKECLGGMGDFLLEPIFVLATRFIIRFFGYIFNYIKQPCQISPDFGVAGVSNTLYRNCTVILLFIGIVNSTGGGGGYSILASTLLGLNRNKPLPLYPARIFLLVSAFSLTGL